MKRAIGKNKPSTCTCLNLRRAALAITKLYNRKLAPSRLTIGQYSLLGHIKFLGPISVSDLAGIIRLDRTTLVRNIKILEKEGLIIDVSQSGTRNRQLQLTDEGLKRYTTAELLWKEAQAFMEQQLGQENLQKLTALLSDIEILESRGVAISQLTKKTHS